MAFRAPRQSADEWYRIIAEFNQSGLAVEDYCTRHGYALSTFNRWKLRYTKKQDNAAPVPESRRSPLAFVEAIPDTSGVVTIAIGDAVRMECPLSLGVEQIAQLAKAVVADERV